MPPNEKGKRKNSNFIVQGGILAAAGVITRIIGLFYRVPVTNIIGDKGNGYYAAAYQIYNILLLISSYSLPLAISRVVSPRYSQGEYRNTHKVLIGGLLFAIVSGGIACLLVFFFSDFFAGVLMSEPMSSIAMRVFAPTLLVVAIMGVIRGYFQGMGTMVPTAISQIIEQIVNAVVSITAARLLFGYGLKVATLLHNGSFAPAYGAAGSTIGTSAGAFAGLLFLLFVLLVTAAPLKRERLREPEGIDEGIGEIMRLIVLTAVPVILSTAIYNISDVLDNGIFNFIMNRKGMEAVKAGIWGVYSGKYKLLINVPVAFANALCSSTVPVLAAALYENNLKLACRRVSVAIRSCMFIALPAAVGLAVLAKPIMELLFSGEVDLAASLLRVGSVSIIFMCMSTLTNGILQGIGHMEVPVRHAAICLVVNLVSLVIMMEVLEWEIFAVLFSNMIFAVLMSVLNHFSIHAFLRYRQEFKRTFIIPAMSAGIMGMIVHLVYSVFSGFLGNMLSILLSVMLGTFVYALCVIRLRGIRESEIRLLPLGRLMVRVLRFLRIL